MTGFAANLDLFYTISISSKSRFINLFLHVFKCVNSLLNHKHFQHLFHYDLCCFHIADMCLFNIKILFSCIHCLCKYPRTLN